MDQSQLKWIADFIWNIADDRLRDVYVRGKYRDVILPFTVLRRLDAVLESTKAAVLERKKFLDQHAVVDQEGALRMAAGQASTTPRNSRSASCHPAAKGSGCATTSPHTSTAFRQTCKRS